MAPHVLVIGGLRPVHKQLKRLGARLSMMIKCSNIKADDAKFYERIMGISPAATTEEWVEMALMLQKLDPVQAIGVFHEMAQEIGVAAAQALGLPFYSAKVIATTRNKDRMRQCLQAAGIDPTPSRKVSTADDIKAFAAQHGYPLILKPIDGWASTGISRIACEDAIAPAIAWFQQGAAQSMMLVEPFLSGEEFSVEAFSEQGQHQIICITQKFKETTHFVELGHCLPAVVDHVIGMNIRQIVSKALTALGVQHGPSHTEVMVTDNGVHIIESHTRLPGDYLPELIKLVSGVDLMELWARQTMGESVLDRVPMVLPEQTFAAIWFGTPNAVGVIERVDGVDQALELSGVTAAKVLLGPGSQCSGANDSFSRAAYAVARGSSPQETVGRVQEAISRMRFIVSCQA